MRKIIFGFVFLAARLIGHSQNDTVITRVDTILEKEEDCTISFFERGEKLPENLKIQLISKSGKTMTLQAFLETNDIEAFASRTLIDLDKDGKKELVINNFTGGAHCCDEFYFFRNTSPGKYQQVARLFAGNTCVNDSNEFLFDFYEQFGYFFTCYACAYQDTSDTGPVPTHHIVLKYNKGRLTVVPGSKELRSQVLDNLGKLAEQPFEPLEGDFAQDGGLRKEFAMNLAVFHYSFGRNLAETQKLFNKYYKFPDAKKVWAGFLKHLQYIRQDNDF